MTSKNYWSVLQFDYAETFSLLREESGKHFYLESQEKARQERDKRIKQELIELSVRGSIILLKEKGIFHPTAVKTNIFDRYSTELQQLGEI